MRRFSAIGLVAALAVGVGGLVSRAADAPDDEQQVGQEIFDELKARGEIIAASPLYDLVRAVAVPIAKTAQPRYNHPFNFYLVHEARPNAFATPGGNVYVTDALLYFVHNTEELAGTLCHEVAHTIRHDSMKLIQKEREIERRQLGATILLGPSRAHVLAISLIGKLRSLGYSREAERGADLTGADVCAASGYNPWGLVWLFQDFEKADTAQVPQLLSDHPGNAHRVAALQAHFRAQPSVFASFSSDPTRAGPFTAPKDATLVFMK